MKRESTERSGTVNLSNPRATVPAITLLVDISTNGS